MGVVSKDQNTPYLSFLHCVSASYTPTPLVLFIIHAYVCTYVHTIAQLAVVDGIIHLFIHSRYRPTLRWRLLLTIDGKFSRELSKKRQKDYVRVHHFVETQWNYVFIYIRFNLPFALRLSKIQQVPIVPIECVIHKWRNISGGKESLWFC